MSRTGAVSVCETFVAIVPGQVVWRWCGRCSAYSALEVGVYVLSGEDAPDLVGTFVGCERCDPDLLHTIGGG